MPDFQPSCTLVVCTRKRPQQLEVCLEAVSRLNYSNLEVLIVENDSENDVTRGLAKRFGASYLSEPVVGLSRARNRGARFSTKEVVAYLDDDAVPEPDWLENLTDEFRDPQVISVLGRVVSFPARTETERIFQKFDMGLPNYSEVMHFNEKTPHWFELANFGGIGIGANMAFRRNAFDRWPGFDETLGYGGKIRGYEDYYALFTLIKSGWEVAFTPKAIVRHPYHPEPPDMDFVRQRYLNSVSSTAAYILFLIAEQPQFRNQTLRYVWNWMRGRRQIKREAIRPPLASSYQVFKARLCGMWLYFSSLKAEE